MTKKVKRLYESFQPQHYILDLKPDRDNMTFSGSVIITGQKVGRPSQRLTFHQVDLVVESAHLTFHDKKGDQDIKLDRINRHKQFDEVRLHSPQTLYPGRYTVSLKFKGKITKSMNGMYPCFFKHDGQDKKLIATQFESHHAREVFPCIDEPEAKATFDLILTTPSGETVLANTPVKSQTKKGNSVITEFETTPKMSTYLLAFVYGEMAYRQAKSKHGVIVRTYATPENVAITDFALQTAVKILDFYNEYFGINYPLPKCDLIALPDFAAGAMENWGCITFREQALLVDPKHTSLGNKQYVALVVAHELAHQWFGNLVTMRWWSDLWLNEGFASWIEYLAVDHLFPEWKMWTQFVVDEQQQALKMDALEHTHPIEVPVYHPDEIRTIFDAISYSKGASVIHMLHDYLGADIFQKGLQYYLKKHSYDNTDTVDLWSAFEEIAHKPVQNFMYAWTTQPGFPLVSIDVSGKAVKVSQRRFFVNPKHGQMPDENWPVPLLSQGLNGLDLLENQKLATTSKETAKIKLNQGQSGFYRTIYNATHLEHLGEQIKKGHLSSIDRLGLLADLIEAAKAGYCDTVDALHFLENFKNENDYAVWDTIGSIIGSLRLIVADEDLREIMKPFIRDLTAEQLRRLGWQRKKSDSHFDQLLRPIILGMAASADEPTVVKRCQDLFARITTSEQIDADLRTSPSNSKIKRGIDIDPDLRGTVFGTAARHGDKSTFDKLLKLHNTAKLSEERVTLSAALTGFEQSELIDRALKIIQTDEVRTQDVVYWIAYSFLNRHAKVQTWQWLKVNWHWLEANQGKDLSFYRLPIYAARSFSDVGFLTDYQKFFSSVMTPALNRSYKQGIEMIQWQSNWRDKALKEVKVFFNS
ncbi:MAG: M1 family metallopeptidase [Candidatus Saccharimonadales bacterium]